jgi:protein TonB
MRRFSVVALSVCVHVVLLATLFIVPLFATDVLPIPRQVVDYFLPHDVMPVVAPPPAMRQAASAHPAVPNAEASSPNAAPIVAPTGISQETGLENFRGVPGGSDAPVAGLPEGTIGGSGFEPPPPTPAAPMRLVSNMKAPRKIADIAPIYPAIATAARAQGIVIMEATIDVHGNVVDVRVLRSSPLLDQAAIDAVRQWKYTPATLNGLPVPVIMTVTVNFTLR